MAGMRFQAVIFSVLYMAAMIAMPFLYSHRMDVVVWIGSAIAFVALPLFVGILQTKANYSLTRAAAVLLLLCPLIYAITDRLDVQFEKLRDGHFLATGATIIFVSAAWLTQSVRKRNWAALVVAIIGLIVASSAVCILLWFVMYLE